MDSIKVPQNIIDSFDIVKLREWSFPKDIVHNKSKSDVQTFVICEGYDGKTFQDENLFFRLQCENKVRKIKFKNINKIFSFYER